MEFLHLRQSGLWGESSRESKPDHYQPFWGLWISFLIYLCHNMSLAIKLPCPCTHDQQHYEIFFDTRCIISYQTRKPLQNQLHCTCQPFIVHHSSSVIISPVPSCWWYEKLHIHEDKHSVWIIIIAIGQYHFCRSYHWFARPFLRMTWWMQGGTEGGYTTLIDEC